MEGARKKGRERGRKEGREKRDGGREERVADLDIVNLS